MSPVPPLTLRRVVWLEPNREALIFDGWILAYRTSAVYVCCMFAVTFCDSIPYFKGEGTEDQNFFLMESVHRRELSERGSII